MSVLEGANNGHIDTNGKHAFRSEYPINGALRRTVLYQNNCAEAHETPKNRVGSIANELEANPRHRGARIQVSASQILLASTMASVWGMMEIRGTIVL